MNTSDKTSTSSFMTFLQDARWVWIAGGAHALVGSAILFLTLHPLRALLEPGLLDLAIVGSALQTAQGVALLALSSHATTRLPALLIAVGTASYSGMLYLIIFTGLHPFDLLVPAGGMVMLLGWIMMLFTRPETKRGS